MQHTDNITFVSICIIGVKCPNICTRDEGKSYKKPFRKCFPGSRLTELTDNKEPKDALDHSAKTTHDSQLACTFCVCIRGNTSPYHQAAVVCCCHAKTEDSGLRLKICYHTVLFSDTTLANSATSNQEYV